MTAGEESVGTLASGAAGEGINKSAALPESSEGGEPGLWKSDRSTPESVLEEILRNLQFEVKPGDGGFRLVAFWVATHYIIAAWSSWFHIPLKRGAVEYCRSSLKIEDDDYGTIFRGFQCATVLEDGRHIHINYYERLTSLLNFIKITDVRIEEVPAWAGE